MTNEAWQNAQLKEINYANIDPENARKDVNIIFDYFGDRESLSGKHILEVGCGTYPLSSFIDGVTITGVEPLFDNFSDEVKQYWNDKNIKVVSQAFEDFKAPRKKYDEVWFFNFLQHTPNLVECVEKAKKVAKKVRVFEPINTAIDELHFNNLTIDFFREQFPTTEIKVYTGGSQPNFHTADCVYFLT